MACPIRPVRTAEDHGHRAAPEVGSLVAHALINPTLSQRPIEIAGSCACSSRREAAARRATSSPSSTRGHLGRHRIRLDEQFLVQRVKTLVQFPCDPLRCRRQTHAPSARSRPGMMLEVTLITPFAPGRQKGQRQRVVAGKNGETAPGSTARSWLTRSTLPPASLMATTFGAIRGQPPGGFHADLDAATRRHAVKNDRQPSSPPRWRGNGDTNLPAKVCCSRERPPARRPRRDPRRPASWQSASRVEFEPVPAMTLQRPRIASTPRRIVSRCSSWSSVADSPVVPTATKPSTPDFDLPVDQPRVGVRVNAVVAEGGDERGVSSRELHGERGPYTAISPLNTKSAGPPKRDVFKLERSRALKTDVQHVARTHFAPRPLPAPCTPFISA